MSYWAQSRLLQRESTGGIRVNRLNASYHLRQRESFPIRNELVENAQQRFQLYKFPLTLAVGAGAKAEAEATMARVQAAVNFMVKQARWQG